MKGTIFVTVVLIILWSSTCLTTDFALLKEVCSTWAVGFED